MKKHTFKKLMSCVLVALMLTGAFAVAIPASAEESEAIYLVPNEDNYVNGVNIRFETISTNSTAMIKDGKLVLRMAQGDMLWFPDLTIKDETTQIKFNMTIDKDDVIPYVATGIQPSDVADCYFYCQGFGNWGKWVCARANWATTSSEYIIKYDAKGDYWYKNDWNYDEHGITTLPGSAICKTGDTLATTTTFTMGDVALRPVTSFKEGNVEEPYIHSYDSKEDVNILGSFGIVARSSTLDITLEDVVATNINGNGGNYTEDFENINSFDAKLINMRQAGTLVEFDAGIGFITFNFMTHKDVTADTEFVVKKNGQEIERRALSTFEAVEGVYTYDTYFMTVEYSDLLTVYLEKDGQVLPESTYNVDYGAQYQNFVENPPAVDSGMLINKLYEEKFDTAITLQPGENDVNGVTWTYVKNSEDGSAVIKDGRLYFTGSQNDMIIIEDVNVDRTAYTFQYDLTYLGTPEDDIWTDWTSWFGSLHNLSAADAAGNRFGYIASVTPNDVYMMQGTFGANGVFTREDKTDHVYFQNIPATPTQPGELYYWNGRVGNAVPTNIKTYGGVDGYDHGGLGMSAYGVTGEHRVSANMPGEMTADQRVGKLGFVCSESKVTVIVDNVSVMTAGKNITVDGEELAVPADGQVSLENLEVSGKKIVYATVDGVAKYVGDIFFATRLTEIFTTQVALSTNKVVADGQTGLKYVTVIDKADYEKLTNDTNIAKVEVGTAVVATSGAKDGVSLENATSNIAGTVTLDGGKYVFEGVLPVDKAARDTSYSGVGYIKVTMVDGKEVVIYSDYFARLHAYALSDLVEEFDDDTETGGENNENNGNNENNETPGDSTDSNNNTTDTTDSTDSSADSGAVDNNGGENKGFLTVIAGALGTVGIVVAIVVVAVLVVVGVAAAIIIPLVIKKKKQNK